MLTDSLKLQIKAIHHQIKTALPGYQPRPAQNKLVAEMANIIAGSYHSYDRIGLIEAGTGTGKSLAYLLAAIPLALHLKKKLVITTATIALQEQLVNKDLPFFQLHSKLPFEFSLVKGRQRYACMQRLQQQLQQPDLFGSNAGQMLSLLERLAQGWKARTWLGDRDTLPEAVPDSLWYQLQSDSHHCPKQQRVHQQCPFHLARAEIEQSQVLVVNHALLLADLASGSSILPPPEECIFVIDEAHHLADVGRDFFSASALLSFEFQPWQDKLQKLQTQLQKLLPQHAALREILKLQDLAQEFFGQIKPIQQYLFQQQNNWFEKQEDHRFIDAQLPDLLARQAEPLAESSGKAAASIEKLFNLLLEQANDGQLKQAAMAPLQQELSTLEHKFSAQQQLWQAWLVPQGKNTNQARWINQQQQQLTAHACPLSVHLQLDDLLFAKAHAVLLCSATLTCLNSFDYIKRELGLTDHPGLRTLQLESPFAYAEKGLIHLPQMQYEPTSPQFTAELCQQLPQFLEKNQGNLVLFASYWQMEEVAAALRLANWSLLVQGEASRQALLELHQAKIKNGQGSILFGTQSFSEGLDLPGALLTNLVITKLPFAVPTSPFEEAMAEAVTKRGGNPFLQLTVPATARKLVQACGRLLRQEQDHGRIVILDRRLVTKSYGKAILQSLPPFQRQIDG